MSAFMIADSSPALVSQLPSTLTIDEFDQWSIPQPRLMTVSFSIAGTMGNE